MTTSRRTIITSAPLILGSLALMDNAEAAGWTNPQAHAYALAKTRSGKPYVTGAAGPNSFDCSGLIQWAVHGATGYSMSKNARDQITNASAAGLQRVSRPSTGDLVYFYGPHGGYGPYWFHAAFYAGGSSIFHAPSPGGRVGYANINVRDSRSRVATRAYYRVTRGTVDNWNATAQHYTGRRPYHY